MRKIIRSLMIIGVVLIALGVGTFSWFSDTETSTGNTFTAATLDITMATTSSWTFPFTKMAPGDSTGPMRIDLERVGSIAPNHIEIDIDTHSFVDSAVESGGADSADEFKKQIRVDILKYVNDGSVDLLSYVNDNADGNSGFISLYDVEAAGVFDGDNISALKLTGSGYFQVQLSLPTDLPDPNDNKYQGDSIQIDFEFGAAQVAGQDVLTD